jgi:hypothetical protein
VSIDRDGVVLTIVQEDHVDVLTHLLPRFETSAQAFICAALLRVAEYSLRNKALLLRCAHHALLKQGAATFSVLERLCDLLTDVDDAAFEPLLRVVVELGAFSFPPAALKRYLFAFSKPSRLVLANYNRLFDSLRTLRARTAASAARSPPVFFDTAAAVSGDAGAVAGLRATVAEPQKTPAAFSVEAWFRLESFALEQTAAPLVALLSRRRESILALTVNRGRVEFNNGGSSEPCAAPKALEARVWHHVVVTHSAHMLRGSTVQIFVNGDLAVPKGSLKAGSSSKGHEWLIGCAGNGSAFPGQLAHVRVYSDLLSPAHVAASCASGPDDLARDAASASLIAVWHAKAVRDRAIAIDVSPEGKHDAALLPNTLVVGSTPLATAIECAGGVKIFLPLLRLLQADVPADKRPRVPRKSVVLSGTVAVAKAAAAADSKKPVDADAVADAAAAAELEAAARLDENERRRSSFAAAVLNDSKGDARILLALLELLREVIIASTLLATATGAAISLSASTNAPAAPSTAALAARNQPEPKKRRRFGLLRKLAGGGSSSSSSGSSAAAAAAAAAAGDAEAPHIESAVETAPVSESLEDEAVVEMSALLGLIGHLLSDVTPKQLRPRVIPVLESIAEDIAGFGKDALTHAAYGALVLNPSLWKNGDFETQSAFIDNFAKLAREKHELVRAVLPIETFMAVLRVHFSSDPSIAALALGDKAGDDRDDDGIKRVASEAMRERLRGEDRLLVEHRNRLAADGHLHALRLKLLGCLEHLLGSEPTDADIEPFIGYLHDCDDPVGVSDVLFVLSQLLTSSAIAVPLATAVGECDGVWAFIYRILNAPCDAARSLATRCVTRLLARMPRQYWRSDTPHPLLVFSEMVRESRKSYSMHVYGAAVELLTDTPVDIVPDEHESAPQRAYRTSGVSLLHALTTMIERNRAAAAKAAKRNGDDAQAYDEDDAEQFGERIAIVAGLLRGLSGGDHDDICQLVLQDLVVAFGQHVALANAMYGQLGWQEWFISLWTSYAGTDVPALALECMVVLLKHGLQQPNGWMLLEDTQTYFLAHYKTHAGQPAEERAREMERQLYGKLFLCLRDDMQRLARDLADARSPDEKRDAKAAAARKAAAERKKAAEAAAAAAAKSKKKSGGGGKKADEAAAAAAAAAALVDAAGDGEESDEESALLTTWSNFVNMVALIEETVFCNGPLQRDERGAWREFDVVEQLMATFEPILKMPMDRTPNATVDVESSRGKNAFVIALRLCLCLVRESPVAIAGCTYRPAAGDGGDGTVRSQIRGMLGSTGRSASLAAAAASPRGTMRSSAASANAGERCESFLSTQMRLLQLLLTRVGVKYNLLLWALGELGETVDTLLADERDEWRHLTATMKQIVSRLPASEYSFVRDVAFSDGAGHVQFLNNWREARLRKAVRDATVPAHKSVEEVEQAVILPAVLERRRKNAASLEQSIKTDEAQRGAKFQQLRDATLAANDVGRAAGAAAMHAVELHRSQILRRLERDWRKLQLDRCVWLGAHQAELERLAYWKLDKREDSQRMRLRMKLNVDGGDHAEATSSYRKLQKIGREASSFGEQPTENPVDPLDTVDKRPPAYVTKSGATVLHCEPCRLVDPMSTALGLLVITDEALLFVRDRAPVRGDAASAYRKPEYLKRDKRWKLSSLVGIEKRRYLLRHSGLELFFDDRTNRLFTFGRNNARTKFLTALVRAKPPLLQIDLQTFWQKPLELLKQNASVTDRWRAGELSNFDYLMHLNTLAGRTYNDMTQYPVFPWVVVDYESAALSLADKRVYRDLTKPVGALTPERLADFEERYESFCDPSIPKFHYGTHYSSAGSTLFFLIRVEPYTTYSLVLQGGKFDHADRLFHTMAATFKNCLTSAADVKETIPEFYYLPDLFCNAQCFDLGTRQTGQPVADVVLPPWARSAHHFVQVMREALESEFVSASLHNWIDLIFGYKQRGREAIAAKNVFYHLTYEDAVDIDSITDPIAKLAIEAQIENFGQTPSQLFDRPHPARISKRGASRVTVANAARNIAPRPLPAPLPAPPAATPAPKSGAAIAPVFATELPGAPRQLLLARDALCVVDARGRVTQFRTHTDASGTVSLAAQAPVVFPTALSWRSGPPYAVAGFDGGGVVLAASGLDDSVTLLDAKQVRGARRLHVDAITCLLSAGSGQNEYLVSGSSDTTVIVWRGGALTGDGDRPLHVLRGHDAGVLCVAVCLEQDVVLSGSLDGTAIAHTLRYGSYLRTFLQADGAAVDAVAMSNKGHCVLHSSLRRSLHSYTLNGVLLGSATLASDVPMCADMLVSRDCAFLIVGCADQVQVRRLESLEITHAFVTPGAEPLQRVRGLCWSDDERVLYAIFEHQAAVGAAPAAAQSSSAKSKKKAADDDDDDAPSARAGDSMRGTIVVFEVGSATAIADTDDDDEPVERSKSGGHKTSSSSSSSKTKDKERDKDHKDDKKTKTKKKS